jgi:hypothetical protein
VLELLSEGIAILLIRLLLLYYLQQDWDHRAGCADTFAATATRKTCQSPQSCLGTAGSKKDYHITQQRGVVVTSSRKSWRACSDDKSCTTHHHYTCPTIKDTNYWLPCLHAPATWKIPHGSHWISWFNQTQALSSSINKLCLLPWAMNRMTRSSNLVQRHSWWWVVHVRSYKLCHNMWCDACPHSR